MKRRELNPIVSYAIYDKEREILLDQFPVSETFSTFLLSIRHPKFIMIPIRKSEFSKSETYHNKVHDCFRLCHLPQEQRKELFVISDHSQVARLLEKLEQVHHEANSNMESKYCHIFRRESTYLSKRQILEKFKIAWMSTPVIYVDPQWALKWLQETLKTSQYFFPFEHSCKELESTGTSNCYRSRPNLQSEIQKLLHLLAIYLRKSIVIRCENSKIPSGYSKVKKIMEYADKTGNYSKQTLGMVFKMPLSEAISTGYSRQRKWGLEIQDKYFAHLEKQALQLLEKAEKSKSTKLSKRAKRNLKMKKAQEAKKNTVQVFHVSDISTIPVNPEENQMTDSIVDLNAYKISDLKEKALTTARNSPETKSSPQMYPHQFIPPQQQTNKNTKSVNTSTSSGDYYQEENSYNHPSNKSRKRNNRHGKRRYQEKKILYQEKVERSDNELASDVKKATLNVLDKFLEKKLDLLEIGNKEAWELKQTSCNYLFAYLSQATPFVLPTVYGSWASNVSLPNSDVDILLTPMPGYFVQQQFLSILAQNLSDMGWVTHCTAILTAKIPVIKLIIDPFVSPENPCSQFKFHTHQDQLALPFLIKVDITLNTNGFNNSGLVSTSYMQQTFNYHPNLKKSLVVVKHLLESAGLNEGYTGGVSSYNIFIMLLCYSAHTKTDFNIPLSEFLLGFLNFFAYEFNAKTQVLRYSTIQSCILSFEEYSLMAGSESLTNSGDFKMLDPINGKLVRASFSRFEEVTNLFRQLAETFKGVEEKARSVALSLMGRGKRNNWEIVSTVQAETETTEIAESLSSLLLIS